MTTSDITDILSQLNAYEGINIWQDIILNLPGYDETRTESIDRGQSDRFALADGTAIVFAAERGEWIAR